MDRYWFLTSTTYGNWLPGDPRGFVSGVIDEREGKVIHNQPMTVAAIEYIRNQANPLLIWIAGEDAPPVSDKG
jgi:hypothetical protein